MKRWLLSLQLALGGLLRNRFHAGLTALGIVIGTAALIIVIHAARATSASVLANVDGLISADAFVINAEPREVGRAGPGLSSADARAMASQADALSQVASYVDTRATVVREARHVSTRIAGVTPGYFDIRRFRVAQGELWRSNDEASHDNVCVLGSEPARLLFAGESAIGQYVRIAGTLFKIVAVLSSRGGSVGNDQDDRIMVPLESFRARIERAPSGQVDAIFAKAKAAPLVEKAARQVEQLLRSRHRIQAEDTPDFRVTTQRELRQNQESIARTLSLLLTAVAAISLLAGGAGLMNVMLGAVTERTYEIGVRLAIGARARDVLAQFLLEAALVSGMGGGLGAVLGISGFFFVAMALSLPFAIDGWTVLAAITASIAIGLIFGLVPARRAARVNPIEALRSR